MRVNLDGARLRRERRNTRLRRGGVSRLAGVTASPDLYYATAKHTLIGLTRSLALRTSR
ncbi:hypothetical protein [Nonomuraea sp. CA-141351]|uniref:hypothetical protein n=1 Tax=Nonomuraea sp. CA-141351 TaxID=3239996 RepID=UPI003D93D321